MPNRAKYNLAFKPEWYWNGVTGNPDPPDTHSPGVTGMEIARLEFKFGDLKQVGIFACPHGDKILYQVGQGESRLNSVVQDKASGLLGFGELIDLIEESIHPGDLRKFNSTTRSALDLSDFATAHSRFYPQLSTWYEDEGREWLVSNRLYYSTNNIVYLAVSAASVLSLGYMNNPGIGLVEAIIFAYFGLSAISLAWSDDLDTGIYRVWRWVLVGVAAIVVSRGLSLPYCAVLIASCSFLYLAVGAIVAIRHE